VDPYVIAVGNVKGGVGKSTTAVQLALHAGRAGRRTLLIDADPGRSTLSWSTRAGDWPHDEVPVIAYQDPDLGRRLAGLAVGVDLVVIDSPHDPASGARVGPMLAASIAMADLLVVPTSPAGADLDRLEDLLAAVQREEARRPLVWRVALTRVDLRRRGLAREVQAALVEAGLPVLPLSTAVPERAAIEDAFGTSEVLVEYAALAGVVLAQAAGPVEVVA
jgi:chromosome partitioning protein